MKLHSIEPMLRDSETHSEFISQSIVRQTRNPQDSCDCPPDDAPAQSYEFPNSGNSYPNIVRFGRTVTDLAPRLCAGFGGRGDVDPSSVSTGVKFHQP